MSSPGKQVVVSLFWIFFVSTIFKGIDSKRKLTIYATSKYFFSGETFSLKCTFKTEEKGSLEWGCPSHKAKYEIHNENRDNELCSKITINNASIDDDGIYTCTFKNNPRAQYTKFYLDRPILKLTQSKSMRNVQNHTIKSGINLSNIQLAINIDAYPKPEWWYMRHGQNLTLNSSKYETNFIETTRDLNLNIKDLVVTDSGEYTLVAVNKFGDVAVTANFTYNLLVNSLPIITLLESNAPIKKNIDDTITLTSSILGYPLPNVKWKFKADDGSEEEVPDESKQISQYEKRSTIQLRINKSGIISCSGNNDFGPAKVAREVQAYEIKTGFGITESPTWYSEGDNVTLKCVASKYDFINVTWENQEKFVKYSDEQLSHVADLQIIGIITTQARDYKCLGVRINNTISYETINIEVEEKRGSVITKLTETIEATISQPVQLNCEADGVPPPHINWYKDNNAIINNKTKDMEVIERLNHTVITSSIVIQSMEERHTGQYYCEATNRVSSQVKVINLMVPGKSKNTVVYFVSSVVILIILVAVVIYLLLKVKRDKLKRALLRKELAAAGILYFKEGAVNSLNPNLNIDEQAELLPYDDRFEFPEENLKLGRQLGCGAFGVVYKAEARGIINAEETTIVAVKTVKKMAENMYIKALASELKIMVHMGRHVNIVNLLGACTTNIFRRELMVIVEYCRFGNIHNYLIKHREVFIDLLQPSATQSQEDFSHDNTAFTSSNGSGMMQNTLYNSDGNSETTNQTLLTTANTGRHISEGYVQAQPEWRTNYVTDYQTDSPRPLSTRELLAWAFQIAKGMEYLVSKKVLHGDLAARNIVLADDNVVKICDFGLARSICKNDEYQKKTDGLLPVKWVAIECLQERLFSTQSDVWSFGVVLWELFSLAKPPYPDIAPQDLERYLFDGHRLKKPKYADDKLYFIMRRCWEHKPKQRPTFTQLQEVLGTFLDKAEQNRYLELNSPYMEHNEKNSDCDDYLGKVQSPDYDNLVTPSPCCNGEGPNFNKHFFPPSPRDLSEDDSGYLKAREIGKTNKFNFGVPKTNSTTSQSNINATELTPMLNLDNLHESGSQSDNEDHDSHKYDDCIPNEENDVFINDCNTTNIKNYTDAVTNPTYVTIGDLRVEGSKPKNTYFNIQTNVWVNQ